MLQLWRRCFLLLLFAGLLCSFGVSYAAPEIMTTDQLQPGMRAIAKTVVQGTKIETFDVEIVGVLNNGASADMILARVSGPVIDLTGGVLHGMSGSPVYIDGKLIGAVAGGWKDLDMKFCYITPIAEMLKIWDMPDLKNDKKIPQVDLKAKTREAEPVQAEKIDEISKEKTSDTDIAAETAVSAEPKILEDEQGITDQIKEAAPIEKSVPVLAEGFTASAFSMLKDRLAPFGLAPYAGIGSTSANMQPVQLEPGSALGVEIVRGDFSLGATGTVTAVEGDKILAFGHPFYRRGNVSYFLTDANVLTSEHGSSTGMKIAQTGNVIGLINQDRSAGIAGLIGKFPSVVPLQIEVKDKQLARNNRYHVQMAYDEELTAALTASMVYSAIDKNMDRTGASTVKIRFEIQANGVPGGIIKRDNMYYGMQDTGQIAIGELFQILNLLGTNTSEEIDIFGIKAYVEVDETRQTASIIEAKPEKLSVKPGETVKIALKLKPYREKEVTVEVPFTVPKTQPKGTMMLEVRGGGLISLSQLMMQQQGIDLSAEEDKTKPLADKIKEFLDTNKNNEIVINPILLPDEKMAGGKTADMKKNVVKANPPKTVQPPKDQGPQVENKNKTATDYIIDNVFRASIEVE